MKNNIMIFLWLSFPGIVVADNFIPNASYSVCFTPNGDCTTQIINTIAQAKKQILVQAYSFTSVPIAKALINAKNKGVDVKIISDKSQVIAKNFAAKFFRNSGISLSIDYKPLNAHNKVMIIDNSIVITGSFNFTNAAQYKNTENLLIIHDANLATKYMINWQNRFAESVSYAQYKLNDYQY